MRLSRLKKTLEGLYDKYMTTCIGIEGLPEASFLLYPRQMTSAAIVPERSRIVVTAVLLGQRIDTAGLERPDMIQSNPLVLRDGAGYVALYRFGVAVFTGMTIVEQDTYVRALQPRISGRAAPEDTETAAVETGGIQEDRIPPGGPIQVPEFTAERFVLLADALAKSVALGRDEREINRVFDSIEPLAVSLASTGTAPFPRKKLLKLIGQILVAQHRVSGRVAVDEKPDILWDRPGLERLHARLEDEYELKERATTLQHKLEVVVETARTVTEILDTNRSTRLELVIVLLIFIETILSMYSIFKGLLH